MNKEFWTLQNIKHYAKICAHLYQLTKLNSTYIRIAYKAMTFLKDKLASASIFSYPNYNEPFCVQTNNNYTELDAVLIQRTESIERV